jgi:hypothetical protein
MRWRRSAPRETGALKSRSTSDGGRNTPGFDKPPNAPNASKPKIANWTTGRWSISATPRGLIVKSTDAIQMPTSSSPMIAKSAPLGSRRRRRCRRSEPRSLSHARRTSAPSPARVTLRRRPTRRP